jgi:flagellar protein FlbT
MKQPMQISLKAGERIYINGAVIRVDSRVTLELLNDASFLLESHVMQPEQTTTPLKQLYFVLQTILMDPRNMDRILPLFLEMHGSILRSFDNPEIVTGLKMAAGHVAANRVFDGLRTVRKLFPLEEQILGGNGTSRAA